MIELQITREFVRAGSSAFGVDVPVHHDTRAAQAAGLPDIFMATPHLGALVERFILENWGARVRDVRLTMRRPVTAGMTVQLGGTATYSGWEVRITDGERVLIEAVCS